MCVCDVTLRVLKVVSPQGSDFVLTAHIPHGETDVLVLHRLDVKPCRLKTPFFKNVCLFVLLGNIY